MFILCSGNYRKCSARVSCIIVCAVAIGRARVGRKESEVLETLMLPERKKNCSTGYGSIKLLYQGTALDPCLRELFFWFLSILKRVLTFG